MYSLDYWTMSIMYWCEEMLLCQANTYIFFSWLVFQFHLLVMERRCNTLGREGRRSTNQQRGWSKIEKFRFIYFLFSCIFNFLLVQYKPDSQLLIRDIYGYMEKFQYDMCSWSREYYLILALENYQLDFIRMLQKSTLPSKALHSFWY